MPESTMAASDGTNTEPSNGAADMGTPASSRELNTAGGVNEANKLSSQALDAFLGNKTVDQTKVDNRSDTACCAKRIFYLRSQTPGASDYLLNADNSNQTGTGGDDELIVAVSVSLTSWST